MLDAEIRFSIAKTSRTRYWSGFEAIIYEATPGFDETICTNHSISMHVGSPVHVTSRCDGATVRRLQTAGDLKVIPAGFLRTWEIERPARKLTINLSRALLDRAAETMGIDADNLHIRPQLHLEDPQIQHIGWALKNELENDDERGRLYAESLGQALASQLIRRYSKVAPRRPENGLSKRHLRSVVDYIQDHLASDLSLGELAELANMSSSHFSACFKQSVGLPVHQYVIRARVERAVHLLVNEKLPLIQVALKAGFANQSHMAQCVQRVAGVTPGQLRRNSC